MGRKSREKRNRREETPVVAAAPAPAFDRLELLKRVGQSQRRIELERRRVAGYVEELRALGVSWADIAAQLGVTRQGARKRFAEGNRSEAEGGSHDVGAGIAGGRR